jgi:hypothetical protein
MIDIARLFQAFLAPAIFVSATALLILSINVRLMGIVSRLRQYVHAKHDAAKNGRMQEPEAYTAQIKRNVPALRTAPPLLSRPLDLRSEPEDSRPDGSLEATGRSSQPMK